jgi:DNA-directed RNA polymerase subunit RPC12/RpoP
MVISSKTGYAKKNYKCSSCNSKITKGDFYTRYYGSATGTEKPYEEFECEDCTLKRALRQILKAPANIQQQVQADPTDSSMFGGH